MKKPVILIVGLLIAACSSKVDFKEMASKDNSLPKDNSGSNTKCVSGKKLGIWLDSNSDGSNAGETKLGSIVSYQGTATPAENYNYFSASAHPIVGPSPLEYQTKVFFYDGPGGLSLNFYFNVDEGGSPDNIVDWDLFTSGNNLMDGVLLSDDDGELTASTMGSQKKYQGRFHYYSNTDGGVIGPFSGQNFQIGVKVLSTGDLKGATFFSADGSNFSLLGAGNAISSFVIAFEENQVCQ